MFKKVTKILGAPALTGWMGAATAALIMTLSSIVGVANATLITDLSERDWTVTGDKAITYDSSTGLEWLDLTKTVGHSILDTEEESFLLVVSLGGPPVRKLEALSMQ